MSKSTTPIEANPKTVRAVSLSLLLGSGFLFAGVGDVAGTQDPEVPRTSDIVYDQTQQYPLTLDEAMESYREGNYEEAQLFFSEYVRLRPQVAWGHYMLGLCAWKSGDLEAAEQSLLRSAELGPENPKARINLCRVLMDAGRHEEALDHCLLAQGTWPENAEAHRVAGRAHQNLGQPNEAITAYQHALIADPEDAWSMNNLGLVYIHQGRYEQALEPLARATELRNEPVFYNNLGIALERSGYPVAARDAYAEAVRRSASYTRAEDNFNRLESMDGLVSGDPGLPILADRFETTIGTWRSSEVASTNTATDSDR